MQANNGRLKPSDMLQWRVIVHEAFSIVSVWHQAERDQNKPSRGKMLNGHDSLPRSECFY